MKDSTRIVLVIICVVLVLFLIGVLIWGIAFKEDFYGGELEIVKEEQYAVENIKEIMINTPRADVFLFRTDDEKVKIVEKTSKKVKEKDLFVATISDDTLKIKDQMRNFCFGFCFFSKLVYEIYIPKSYQNDISITTTSGDIKINSLEELRNIKLLSVSGDIKLNGGVYVDGASFKTTSGDIEIDDLKSISTNIHSVSGEVLSGTMESSEAEIKTTSGDIELDWVKGEIEVNSVSGDVELDHFYPIGDSNFKTTSGEIEIMLDKKASVKMRGDSVSGDIRFPNSGTVLGDGEHSMTLKTTSGDIKVRVTEK